VAADLTNGLSETIVTEVFEVLSPGQVTAGMWAIVLTFPSVKLRPNEFSLYVWVGRSDRSVTYDAIDENVALPRLVINPKPESSGRRTRGLVSVDYEIRKVELDGPASATDITQKY
jgi:hypothetical protein